MAQTHPRPTIARRMPVGAEVSADGVHFRVWAPRRKRVTVKFADDLFPAVTLSAEGDGYFSGLAKGVKAGARYWFFLDDDTRGYPDPVSRFQPAGPHGPSEVVDPLAYAWQDSQWRGAALAGQVLYEMHIGTFAPRGTWAAAIEQLPALVDLGVTLVEPLPIAEFAGEFGWGYDGVNLFAPYHVYGTPDDFRRFVDRAHQLGLGVILDVVYNHFGPTGNYLGQFSSDYISSRHHTAWGEGINYDGTNCGPVREFFISNAGYWIDEFHVDGLRLDAVQAIMDDSADHILAALTRRVRDAAGGRRTLVFAENELQDTRLLRSPAEGGFGLDAAWNDDFHHAARVAMSGHNEYYFGDYQGTPQELISAAKFGYLYQGQWNVRQQKTRGAPALDIPGPRFVTFLQNHDQVSNSPHGLRCHELTSPGRHRAMTALWALAPGTPLLFQGQEFSASNPFLYFADHEPDLAALVREGRHNDLRNFGRMSGADAVDTLADPGDPRTFDASKLDFEERHKHAQAYALHRDLLKLRRDDPVFAQQRSDRLHGAVLSAEAFLLRYLGAGQGDRMLLINMGRDLELRPASEPLLAPSLGRKWQLLWSSENPRYGGTGTNPLDSQRWYLPGHAAIVLTETDR